MTRAERDALREQRLKDRLAVTQTQLDRVQAKQREDARKDRNKRRFQVGALAEAAGLCAWDDATLAGVFQVLARLKGAPDPVKVLDALLASQHGSPVCEVCCAELLLPRRLQTGVDFAPGVDIS